MAGGSCVGHTQWLAAADDPPHLKAIVPVVSPPDAYLNEPICNGCFLLPMGEWMLWMGRRSWQTAADRSHFDVAGATTSTPCRWPTLAERAGFTDRPGGTR